MSQPVLFMIDHDAGVVQALLQHLYQRAGRLARDGGPVLDCWQYHISKGQDVVIVTYGCYVASTTPPVISNEHKRAGLFTHGEVPDLNMPDGYKRSIMTWFSHLTADSGQTRP